MPRPKHPHPTPGELEVLQILWDAGPATVRDVLDVLQANERGRAYTSVMSLLNVMAEKGLVKRTPQGRAFLYVPVMKKDAALGRMVRDLCRRAFEGSASTLVTRLLDETNPSDAELKAIRDAIRDYERRQP
ncbi:MAG: BlaI/MecI/CopY family transcriptional regulator [Planctomycetota bacterium]|nr:BlaI/MecI/CopY family transcriptional regulator [Planctomycetaceae bacterium]MDQ3330488.1 BlaI/MecI/CopY family transcriptional regulator [Planctomycetota bacterium]